MVLCLLFFSSNKDKISKYVGIGRNEKIGEVLHSMNGLGLSIAKDNYEKGQQFGMQQGISQGQELAFSLMQKLFEAGRLDDAKRVTSDKEFLNQLLKEFALI